MMYNDGCMCYDKIQWKVISKPCFLVNAVFYM